MPRKKASSAAKKAKINENSDSDEPPDLVPVAQRAHISHTSVPKHTAPRRRAHAERKEENSSDDDEPPALVPLKMFNTTSTPHNNSGKPSKATAQKVKAVPPPFQKGEDKAAAGQAPVAVHKDAAKSTESRSQIQAANVARAEDDDEMSMCADSSGEDDDAESSYATEDEDLEDDEDDEDLYDDDETGDEDEEDDEDDEDELDNVCQCPTCQRERERSIMERSRKQREMEDIAAMKLASRIEKIRKACTPTGPGTRTIPYAASMYVSAKHTADARLNYQARKGGKNDSYVQNIVYMQGYADKCQEELRFEDYAIEQPELKKLKDHLASEMSDRASERVCRESMAINEAAIRRWMVSAATAWNQFLKGKDVYEQQKAGDSKETASEFFTLSLKTCATGDHARGCFFLRAKCNMKTRPQLAINDLISYIKLDKYNAEAHYLLGALIMDSHTGSETLAYERAEQYLLKAQSIQPSLFADPESEYSKKLSKVKDKAAEARAIALAEIKKNAGNAALQRNSYVEAEELYTAALDLTSTSDKSHIYFSNRAAARFEIGMASDTKKDAVYDWLLSAVSDCDKSLALRPDYTKAQFRKHFAFAEASFLKNNFVEASAAFAAALELDKENKLAVAGVKKTKNALAAIEARELVANMEKLQLEREVQQAEKKEQERKAVEEKRLEQEQLRREKAEKEKTQSEARAKAKQEREANAKEAARLALEEKKAEKEKQKAEKEASKLDKVGDKEAERAAKRAAKEKAKEEERLAKQARAREAAAAVEAARIKREEFAKEMERVAAVVAGNVPASSAAAAVQASKEPAGETMRAVPASPARKVKDDLTPTLEPASAVTAPSMSSATPAAAPVPTPAAAPARKVGGSVSALSAIASSVGAVSPSVLRKPPDAGDKAAASAVTAASAAVPTDKIRVRSSSPAEELAEPDSVAKATPASKPVVAAAAAPAVNAKAIRTVHMEIEPAKVGAVIGAKGVIINEIMKRSGAKIIVNQDFPGGAPQRVVIQGNTKQLTDARPLLAAVIAEGPHALTQPSVLRDYLPGGVHELLPTLSTVSAVKEYEAAYALAIERQSLVAGASQSSSTDPSANAQAMAEPDVEAPQCIICCEPIDGLERLHTCGSCEHTGACSTCFLRLRSISKSNQCPMCRTVLGLVFATYASDQSYMSLHATFVETGFQDTRKGKSDCMVLHSESNMVFPKEHLRSHVMPLYSHRCPVEHCNTDCKEQKRLRNHLQSNHNCRYCELCVQHKQVFPSEQIVYTSVEYIAHLKGGEGGKDGHPSCSYCQTYFYNKSDLFAHVSAEHKVCALCSSDGNQKYYRDQAMLHQHYHTSHFTCEEPSCVAKPAMTAYRSLFDLQAHKRETHGSSFSANVHSSMPLPKYTSNHHGIAYKSSPGRGGALPDLQDDLEAFPALGSSAAYPPLCKETQKQSAEFTTAVANFSSEAAAAAAVAAAAGSNTSAPAFYPRPQSRSSSLGNGLSPLVNGVPEPGQALGDADYRGDLRSLEIDSLLLNAGNSGFQQGSDVRGSDEQQRDVQDFEDNVSSIMMYDAQAQALLSDADQSDQMYPDGLSGHQFSANGSGNGNDNGNGNGNGNGNNNDNSWSLMGAAEDVGAGIGGMPMYSMNLGLHSDPLESFQLPMPATLNTNPGDSLMRGFNHGLGGMGGGHVDDGVGSDDDGGSLSGTDFLGLLGPEDAVGGVPLRFNRSGGGIGMSMDGLSNDARSSFGFGTTDNSPLTGNATSASYLLSTMHGNRLDHNASTDLLFEGGSSLSLPQMPLSSFMDGPDPASSTHDATGAGGLLGVPLAELSLNFNEDELEMGLGARIEDDDGDNDSFVSEGASGLGTLGADCRIPVHDLPHDHFHELDEVSASNAAIIRATFAPEFIDRLIGVLRSHPGGILGSAFPEAYRKMYGQRLILETKRGKKIKLLSVLEGHPNFYKSGMRVGGLKLHYQPNHDEGSDLSAEPSAALAVPVPKPALPRLTPTRFGPDTSSAFANATAYVPSIPAAGAEIGAEPGLEVDLLSADDFPLVSWMREHGMHMFRWAGNDVEWTEYALSLRPELLTHLTAADHQQPSTSGLGGAGSEGPVSLVEQLKSDTGCDVTVQTERLNGIMAHFLVMVRGSSGTASIPAFDRCQRMLTQTILAAMHSWVDANLTRSSAGSLSGREADDGYVYTDEADNERIVEGAEDGRVHSVLDIPQSTVALIQGNNGKRLHLLRKKSGAFVSLMTKVKGKGPAKLNISGTAQAVAIAINLVKDVIAAGV